MILLEDFQRSMEPMTMKCTTILNLHDRRIDSVHLRRDQSSNRSEIEKREEEKKETSNSFVDRFVFTSLSLNI